MKDDNIVLNKSFDFAVRIVRLYQYLCEQQEFILSKQLLKSGTSIGANIREAVRGQSRNDFIAKMNIALKEVSETEYWLELLFRTNYMTQKEYESIFYDCHELTKLLSSIVKTTKNNS